VVIVVVLVRIRVVYSKKYHLHSVLANLWVGFGGSGWTLGSGLGLVGGSDLGSDLRVDFGGPYLDLLAHWVFGSWIVC